jgi:hypothetical protein
MKVWKATGSLFFLLWMGSCGHKPFYRVTHDRDNSINYVVNLNGNNPQVSVIINSQRGSRGFTLSPSSADASSYAFWNQLSSSFQMSLGSHSKKNPELIELFCFPACHFSYTSTPLENSLKMGPTLFPNIKNNRGKLNFPIHIDIHYTSPHVYTTYCTQKRHCKIDKPSILQQQLTYKGQTFPTHSTWKSHDINLILTKHDATYSQDHHHVLNSLFEKLSPELDTTPYFKLPNQLTIFLIPAASFSSVPPYILNKDHLILISQALFDTPEILLRVLLSTSLQNESKDISSNALIDAYWFNIASKWGMLSVDQQNKWIYIHQSFIQKHHSKFSKETLNFLTQINPKLDLNTPSINLTEYFLYKPLGKGKLVLWSHPEVKNIQDEPPLNPILLKKGPWIANSPGNEKL